MAHPTAEQIDELVAIADACRESKDLFATRLRRIMGLAGEVRISKRFLKESITMAQFEVARGYYDRLLKQQVEEDVPDGTDATARNDNAPEAIPETPPTGAPHPLPTGEEARPNDEAARAKLRQEAIGWGIRPDEVEHVMTHYPLDKARTILWQARRRGQTPDPQAAMAV